MDWFQIGKGVRQGCILLHWLFNFYAVYIMQNSGLDEAQAGIKIAGEISITSDMQMIPPLWKLRGTKESLDEGERGVQKSRLKTQHSKSEDHGIIPSLHGKQMGKQWKQWETLFSWAPK